MFLLWCLLYSEANRSAFLLGIWQLVWQHWFHTYLFNGLWFILLLCQHFRKSESLRTNQTDGRLDNRWEILLFGMGLPMYVHLIGWHHLRTVLASNCINRCNIDWLVIVIDCLGVGCCHFLYFYKIILKVRILSDNKGKIRGIWWNDIKWTLPQYS